MKNRYLLAMIIPLLTACASWPEPGQGGVAERGHTPELYTAAIAFEPTPASLARQLQQDATELSLLEQQGARACAPASLRAAELQKNRYERELDAGLIEDAYNNAVVLRQKIHQLQNRMDYLRRKTQCAGDTVAAAPILVHPTRPTADTVSSGLLLEIHFDTASAMLSEAHQQRLQKLADLLLARQDRWRLEISAHSDDRADTEYNRTLAEQRAHSVAETLLHAGIPAASLTVASNGESLPLLSERNESARMLNRRVEIWLISDARREVSRAPDAPTAVPAIPLKAWPEIFKQPADAPVRRETP